MIPDFARDYIIDCPGCQKRKVIHTTDWPQATIRLIKQGWMQTVSGGWLCPKCVGPDSGPLDYDSADVDPLHAHRRA